MKETFRETIVLDETAARTYFDKLRSLIDEVTLTQNSQYQSLTTEINKRPTPISFNSPTTVIQQSNTTNKLSQDKGEVTIETTGSGNIVLRSAGSVVVSGSTLALGGNESISGNLTVDTDTFYVDSENNTVSVGTTTQRGVFTVGTTTDPMLYLTTEGNLVVSGTVSGTNLSQASSTEWNTAYNTIQASSSNWDTAYTWLTASSSGWSTTENDLTAYLATDRLDWIISGTSMNATDTLDVISLGTSTTLYVDILGNRVGVGTSTPLAFFDVYAATDTTAFLFEQDSTGDVMDIQNATGTVFYVNNAGQLGLGTTTISGLLTVGAEGDVIFNVSKESYVQIGTSTSAGLFTIASTTATSSGNVFRITTEGDLAAGILIDNDGTILYGSDLFYVNTPSQSVTIGTSTSKGIFTVGTTTGDTILNVTTEGNIVFGTSTAQGLFTIATSSAYSEDGQSFVAFNVTTEGNVVIGTSTPSGVFTVATSTTSMFNITAEGNIGIGTAGPLSKLQIVGTESDTVGTANAMLGIGIDSDVPLFGFRISATNGEVLALDYRSGGANYNSMVWDRNGNVGIGASAPIGKLHVYSGNSEQTSVHANANDLVIEDVTNSGLTILSGSSSVGSIAFGDAQDNLIASIEYDHSTNGMNFYVNNTNAMFINSSANVGILDSTPDFGLEINASSSSGYFAVSSVDSDGNIFVIDELGYVGIGTAAPNWPLSIGSGNAMGGVITKNTQNVSSAASILSLSNNAGGLVIVHGKDNNASNQFIDTLIASDAGDSVTVLNSVTTYGTPHTRTYTWLNPDVQLQMGAGAVYDITAVGYLAIWPD